MTNEWKRFVPKASHETTPEAWDSSFRVHHTTHLPAARKIAEDKRVTAQPIYDGKLAQTKTTGVFLSPNTWAEGYIYGSVQFSMPVEQALHEKSLFWVERIDRYSYPILRFLASRSVNTVSGGQPYDPRNDDGPLKLIENALYWPKPFVIEIIFDLDIPVDAFKNLEFVAHRGEGCILGDPNCREKKSYQKAWSALMGSLLSSGQKSFNELLCPNGTLTDAAETGLEFLLRDLTRNNQNFGGLIEENEEAASALREAMFDLFDPDARQHGRELISKFCSQDLFDRTFQDCVRDHFNTPDFRLSDLPE